jgi:hypothetical protein
MLNDKIKITNYFFSFKKANVEGSYLTTNQKINENTITP